jgi:hypothetical protein
MHEPGTGHYALLRAFQEDDVLDTMVAEAEKHDYLAHEFGDAVLLERSEMIPNDGAAVMPRRRTRMNTLVTSTSRKVVSPSRRLAGPPGFAQPARLRPRWLSASYTEYPAAPSARDVAFLTSIFPSRNVHRPGRVRQAQGKSCRDALGLVELGIISVNLHDNGDECAGTDFAAANERIQSCSLFVTGSHCPSPTLKALAARGSSRPTRPWRRSRGEEYGAAQREIVEAWRRVTELYKAAPVILVSGAPGPAPRGLTSTGDSRMNAPWTSLGTSAISIPLPVAPCALPLGPAITADRGEDARVVQSAVRLHRILHAP